MWERLAILIQANKDDVIDREDGLTGNHVPHLSAHGDGGCAELGGNQTHLDEVAFNSGGNEVDLRDDLGHHTAITQLQDGIDRGFFINPLQQRATKECAIGIEVLGAHPLAGGELNLTHL